MLRPPRRIQRAAAFLNVDAAGSDDIVGAVCAQKFANVPLPRVVAALDGGWTQYQQSQGRKFFRGNTP